MLVVEALQKRVVTICQINIFPSLRKHKTYLLNNYPWKDDSDPEESIEYLEDCHNFYQSPSEDGSFGSESVGDTLSESGLKLNKM